MKLVLIWSEFITTKVDKDSTNCQGNTILNLLLSFNIILIVQCALTIIALLSTALFSYKKDSKVLVVLTYAFSRLSTCFAVLCYKAMLGINIAMTVLLYSKSCGTKAPKIVERMQPFIITQFVLLPFSLCCVTCCVTCNAIVNSLSYKEMSPSYIKKEEEMIQTKLLDYSDNGQ
uniref:Differentiation-specific protein 3'-1 n=1 Tax=Naegleria gruberi TaxID=5762 RepID=Q6QNG3_NAEGR|nr:differentiation-specific protein 3'-1 [Naegleria gruberi]